MFYHQLLCGFDFLRISDLTENMQNLSTKIKAFETRELMSMEEMKKSVEKIKEINLDIKEYLNEIEVAFIEFPLFLKHFCKHFLID